jgi:protein-L-isoaspartate(D-aspartate) O-methyltransferase
MRGSTQALAAIAVAALGCTSGGRDAPAPTADVLEPPSAATPAGSGASDATPRAGDRAEERERMVREQIEARGLDDEAVLAAMRSVPRHRFMPEDARHEAYRDHPVPIGEGQTISQPYIVALMSQLARIGPGARVLEIGTGSGYQAAVLAAMGARVWSIEIVPPLAEQAARTLEELGYEVRVRQGDGYAGWPEEAPFDAILLTAAPPEIPPPLVEQLAPEGRLVAPVGRGFQELVVVTASPEGPVRRTVLPVRFVPMTGRAQSE